MASIHEQYRVAQLWFRSHYTQMFHGLLPNGFIWKPRHWGVDEAIQDVYEGEADWQDTVDAVDEIQDVIYGEGSGDLLMRIFAAIAGEWERIEADAWDLFNQSAPGLSVTLLEDWERNLGLPEDCYDGVELSVEQRQAFAHTKMFAAGATTTRQWYLDFAEYLGYTIDVTESPVETNPAICDVAICDVAICDGRGGYSNMIVHILEADHDVTILECMLNKLKQAHVMIYYWDYTESGDAFEIVLTGIGTKTITFRGTGTVYIFAGDGDDLEELELLGASTDVVWTHDYATSGPHYVRFFESDS